MKSFDGLCSLGVVAVGPASPFLGHGACQPLTLDPDPSRQEALSRLLARTPL